MLYNMMWYLLIYGFLGWCCEVIFAACSTGKFVNRGFCCGPICPIYGFGVLILFVLEPFKDNIFLLFLLSALLTSALEFVTGFVLEKIFHDKWWDYTDMPFNIKGYICLKFSIMWGLACVFVVRLVHPMIAGLVDFVPHKLGVVFLAVLYAAFLADVVVTVINVFKLSRRIRGIEETDKLLRSVSDKIGAELSEKTLTLMEKNEELKKYIETKRPELKADFERYSRLIGKKNIIHNRIIKAFPSIQKGHHKRIIDKIKEKRL